MWCVCVRSLHDCQATRTSSTSEGFSFEGGLGMPVEAHPLSGGTSKKVGSPLMYVFSHFTRFRTGACL